MATNVTFKGTTYSVPTLDGEDGWATTLSTYLQAIASGAAVNSVVKQTSRVALTSPVTVAAATDFTVVCKLSTPGAVTVNLPAGATGQVFAVVDGTGDAGTNAVTIDASGAETINGQLTYAINENFGGVLIHWNGTGWNVLADFVGNDPRFTSINVSGTATIGTVTATNATVGGVAVTTISNTQTLTGKSISGADNTLSAIPLASLNTGALPAAITIASANIASAAIARTKLAIGSNDHVVINSGSGEMSSEPTLARTRGGTGITSTATFPASGVVATRDASETLLNKLISSTAAITGALTLPTSTTANRPSPATGMIRHNTDTNEFEGFSAGAWQSVGGGLNEQPLKNYLRSNANASISPGALSTVAVGGDIATTAGLWYSRVATAFTVTNPSSTLLRGSFNYLSGTNTSANVDGTVFFQLPAFALEGSDLGKPVSLSFDTTGNTAANDWDVVVARYNSSGVFQGLIPVAGNASQASSGNTPSAQLPTGVAQFRGFFVPTADVDHLYAVRFRRLAGATQIRLDTLYAGPQVQLLGAAITASQSYTPTGSWTNCTYSGRWKQEGEDMILSVGGEFTGTPTGGALTVSLPSGLTIDTTKLLTTASSAQIIGDAVLLDTGVAAYDGVVVYESTTAIRFQNVSTGAPFTFGNGDRFTAIIRVPISQFSSNTTMAERAVEEYAWNSSGITAAGASNSAAFSNGPDGAAIGSIASTTNTSSTTMRVRFQTPIQATDSLTLEFKEVNKQWAPFAEATGTSQFLAAGSKFYGVKIDPFTGNTTDVDVIFYNSGYRTTSGTYAQDGSPWSDLSTARWRLRKVSGGAAVGFPVGAANIVGRTDGLAPAAGMLGEQIRGAQLSNTAFPATNTYGDLTSISLTAGVWDISAVLYGAINTAGGLNIINCGISSTAGNSATGLSLGDNLSTGLPPTGTADTNVCIPQFRVVIGVTTIYYLKYLAAFSSGSPNARGRISAVRIA